jgi:hypothetical protein
MSGLLSIFTPLALFPRRFARESPFELYMVHCSKIATPAMPMKNPPKQKMHDWQLFTATLLRSMDQPKAP